MNEMNRLYNTRNPAQGDAKRVLCICSAGLLRSPTAAWVLSNAPFNFNTRSAGIEDSYALIRVDAALNQWAHEVVCMTPQHAEMYERKHGRQPDCVLDITDNYAYRDNHLIQMIEERYAAWLSAK